MPFSDSDPLSELVWSPRKGLSIKHAESGRAKEKPVLLWNVGPSSKCFESKGIGDERVDHDNALTMSQTFVTVDDEFGDKVTFIMPSRRRRSPQTDSNHGHHQGRSSKMEDNPGITDAVRKEENSKDNEDENMGNSNDFQIADIAVKSKENVGTRTNRLVISAENDPSYVTLRKARSIGETRLTREDPVNSRICLYQEKGKAKAFSDGDIYGRSSNNEDASHESVQSYSSAKLFLKGIKRQSSDQELMVGSKRMKKEIQESYGSKFVIRNNSSFKSWISNMAKGLSELNNAESLVALASSKDVYSKQHQKNSTDKKVGDTANVNVGFQSMFQLYHRKTSMSDSGGNKVDYSVEETKEFEVIGKTSVQKVPRDNFCKQIVVSNKEVNLHISQDIVVRPSKPWICSADFACTSYARESETTENEAFNMMVCNKEKGSVTQSEALLEQVSSTAQNTNVGIPLATNDMPEKHPHSSLWITRLCTRTKSENWRQIIQEVHESSEGSPNNNPGSRVTDVLLTDHKSFKAMDISDGRFVDMDFSDKPSPLAPFQKFQSSEPSVFAEPVGAPEYTIPWEQRNSPTCILTCFFCGKMGHDLRDCTMVTETELEDLHVKISSSKRVEGSSFMCIRCCRSDHWAISCPLVSSSQHLRPEKDASITSHRAAETMNIFTGNANYSRYLETEEYHEHVDARPLASNLKQASSERCLISDKTRKSTISKNLENDLKYGQDLDNAQNKVALAKMFHAIRKLCLSRTDILRWIKSDVSLSRLDGFFLRLRLGKMELGQGNAGYYVARISGDASKNTGCELKKSIWVDVGGIKSSIGSRYISNHDFQEDEIDAWWSRMIETGGKIPSFEELNSKFKDKKNLDF